MSGWTERSLLLAIFLLSFAIRGWNLSALAAFPDELTYVGRAIHILGLNGGWALSDMWDQPPLLTYILAAVIGTVGGTLDSLRLVSVAAGSVTVVIAYFLGKSMYGRVAGFVASAAMAVDGFHILYSRLLYIEALSCMLVLGATLFFYEGLVKRKNLKSTVVGGILFGLALDAKYIALVMAVALVFFLVVYRKRLLEGFPKKGVPVFFGVAVMVLMPVIIALALANANPLYYDLQYRFQLDRVQAVAVQIRSGALFVAGFQRFVQVFFHISSTNPFQAYPPIYFEIPVWIILVSLGLLFFMISFLLRRNPADGLLFILFLAFLAFAFAYPGKRTYFSLYPSLVFFIMLGRITQLAIEKLQGHGGRHEVHRIMAFCVIFLTTTGIVLNAVSVPTMYKNGFGDWDELYPIMTYMNQHSGNNTYVATTLAEIGFYVKQYGINASLASMKQPVALYSQPIDNQTLMTPTTGQYPIYWVISTNAIEKMSPQFIVMPRDDYLSTDTAFRLFLDQRYYQPLNTKLVLLFEIRP